MTINGKKSVSVAVAVLTYGEQLLLATRPQYQHQGGKLEFVGGKIEQGESPKQALVREVAEEIGLEIWGNLCVKLGRICHDYGDKQVELLVYQVFLNDEQYQEFKSKDTGLLGQTLAFYDKAWAMSVPDKFPKANERILGWLGLPECLVITQTLESMTDWQAFYAQKLSDEQTCYLRPKAPLPQSLSIIISLLQSKPKVRWVLGLSEFLALPTACQASIFALKLTASELTAVHQNKLDVPDMPLLVGVHDALEAMMVNDLAQKYPIWGALVSPVLPTQSHPKAPPLGWQGLAGLAGGLDVPVLALGGLDVSDLAKARKYGAVAVSGIRGFL